MGCVISQIEVLDTNILNNNSLSPISNIETELTPEIYYESNNMEDPINFNSKSIYKEV
jgi:hypothetical protein